MAVTRVTHEASISNAGTATETVSGEFVDRKDGRYYAIRNVDRMPPFFMTLISSDDHWLFASSTGGLTAGRVSPETALFPYVPVDRIHESDTHTGCVTRLRIHRPDRTIEWDPFVDGPDKFDVTRNLYKSVLGDRLCFEEINHDLGLAFRYTWLTSDRYGFVRHSELENLGDTATIIDLVDGLRNLLPAGTPRFTQTNSSNLVDAYKWTELDPETGLVLLTLYSGITDRAEPCESLKANVAYCLGLPGSRVLISEAQISGFRRGEALAEQSLTRGVRGAFLVNASVTLGAHATEDWQIVANTEQSQAQVVDLRHELGDRDSLGDAVRKSISDGNDALARIMAAGDAFQATAEEAVGAHHYANVLFNVLRGGIFFAQYRISGEDFRYTVRAFNRRVYDKHQALLEELPDTLSAEDLVARVAETGDAQLARLCGEYLPITFGRRHGDPSRPWNQFTIRLRDNEGYPLLSYEGNWRDIFQNWEALALSFPEFIESMIAKFVNASTVDGYNPYRITKHGIDWEVEEPDDPWSYIGYWGDHQIIYLLKLLELSQQFHPGKLGELLHAPLFCYANVPYRIRTFAALLEDPKTTVDYDDALAARIEERVATLGADGKLVVDADGDVYQVNLLEKLLVPLLSKLGNFVVDGGIWMNTQRPEWNDANNALVGQGLSMVTLYYLRRYIGFLDELLSQESGEAELSADIGEWLSDTARAFERLVPQLGPDAVPADLRRATLVELGEAAARYREVVYRHEGFKERVSQSIDQIRSLLANALVAIDHSIATNRRDDRLYHAYNLLDVGNDGIDLKRLYPMLEGQVSVLSSGAIPADEAVEVLDALFASEVYRADQDTFMLYPDRDLPGFLDKNRIPPGELEAIPLAHQLLDAGDQRLVLRDADGTYRFNADFGNVRNLDERLDELAREYGDAVKAARAPLRQLYETVFNHQAFTGRSGTMFGFEGLGCIYWHMVSKLLLAVQENFFQALDASDPAARRLGELYYRVRQGIGFNKSPAEFGAFPLDPYSHTPKHAGAQQPGMTGQVKEEVITRFGELGVRVVGGRVRFMPQLLRRREFVTVPTKLRYVDVDDTWQTLEVPAQSLAFTWCQVPIVYHLSDGESPSIRVSRDDEGSDVIPGAELTSELSRCLFRRDGRVRRIDVDVPACSLFAT